MRPSYINNCLKVKYMYPLRIFVTHVQAITASITASSGHTRIAVGG